MTQTLIKNGLSNVVVNDILGNTKNLAEASSKTSTETDLSAKTVANISDSLFGSTPSWLIAVIVVSIVVVICIILLFVALA